jgi:DNA-binding response OmpR family regulator
MSIIEKRPSKAKAPAFALVMESDLDLRAVIRTALQLDGHRVECVADCAGVLAWRDKPGRPAPDEFVLALGAVELDPEWETLKSALDDDAMLSRAAVIVLLTIRNGLTFPARARILQKPFAIEELLALVASDMAPAPRLPV